MDDDPLNMRNWGYYEPFKGGHLGLQLMSSMTDRDTKPYLQGRDPMSSMTDRDTKPYLQGRDPMSSVTDRDIKPYLLSRDPMSSMTDRDIKPYLQGRDPTMLVSANGTFHPRDCVVSEAQIPMNYVRDNWISQRDRFLNMLPLNANYAVLPETSGAPSLQIVQPIDTSRDERVDRVEEPCVEKEGSQLKKRQGGVAPKPPKAKKPRKPKNNDNASIQRVKPAKKTMEVVINGIDMDISSVPIPVCSCTGTPQQCYRWGCGGWQSACCTTNVSMYPLPMSTKRRGARIAGRKMSQGAFKKVLEKLAAEGYNFANPIDLRNHWARHGTNKFVTIR